MTFLFHTRIDWRKFKLAVCFLLTGCHCMCVWGWFVQEKSRKYNGKVHFVILYPKSVPSGCIKMDRPFFFFVKSRYVLWSSCGENQQFLLAYRGMFEVDQETYAKTFVIIREAIPLYPSQITPFMCTCLYVCYVCMYNPFCFLCSRIRISKSKFRLVHVVYHSLLIHLL